MNNNLDAAQRRYIRTETLIGAVINTAVSALFVWIVFRGMTHIPLWGSSGLAMDLIPTCFAITLVVTFILTLMTRARLKSGKITGIAVASGVAGRLPRLLIVRAVVFALVVTLVLVPLSAGLLHLADFDGKSFGVVLVFKMIYGALLSLIISPPILQRALADRVGAAA